MKLNWIITMVIVVLLGASPARSEVCGRHEVQKLEEFGRYVSRKRDMLNAMAKAKGISDSRVLSLKLLADNLHSVYLVSTHMNSLVSISCNILLCHDLDVAKLIQIFELANMGFGGLYFSVKDLKDRFAFCGMHDIEKVCEEVMLRLDEIDKMSWQFYGRLYEMRGEPNPPSP